MKKSKNIIISVIVAIILIVGAIIGIIFYLNSNTLTTNEKKFIDENKAKNTILNVNVINNVNIFGKDGNGIYYEFLKDFKSEYGLNINIVTYDYGSDVSGVTLGTKKYLSDNDLVLYTDHYVLVSSEFQNISNISELSGEIAILTDDENYISKYIKNNYITYKTYNTVDEIISSGSTYAIIPLNLYVDKILSNNLQVLYHFSDINLYYTLYTLNNDTFSNILLKYYNNWDDNFESSYNTYLFNIMQKSLNISDADVKSMQSVSYKYGFINNSPYEIIYGGVYGGIAAVYLKNFSSLTNVDLEFTRYKDINKFNKALASGDIDIYFNYYNINTSYTKTYNGINSEYVIALNSKNSNSISSINSLVGRTVYADKNSYIYSYLTTIDGINVEAYDGQKGLLKLNNQDVILVVDKNIYDYYHNHGLENYTIRYDGYLKNNYGFCIKNNDTLYTFLNRYMSITDPNYVINEGFYNHENISRMGIIVTDAAEVILGGVVIAAIVFFINARRKKKVKISMKIKKDDTLKYIDQLTLLKNRNYLNENLKRWSNNTIYPQSIVVLDLNKLQSINDTEGYEEGDKQIRAAANVLIHSQLNNSEIIRTDGNEFVIYLVGYPQKQITNYVHKLNKEFKKLPYDYGAEFGYSMIVDDIKTIEDALNEAVKDLKKQKGQNERKD